MDQHGLISTISIISFFVILLLDLFLLTVKTKNRLSNTLLAFTFLTVALDISAYFTYPAALDYPNLAMFRSNLTFLFSPLLYLYITSVCYSDFRLKLKHLLHALPLLIVILVLIPRYYLADINGKFWLTNHFLHLPEGIFINIAGHIQAIGYLIAMFILLRNYKKVFLENYADIAIFSYQWLYQLTMITAIAHIIVILQSIFRMNGNTAILPIIQILVMLQLLTVLCWIILKTMYSPELFRGISSNLQLVENLNLTTVHHETIIAKKEYSGVIKYQLEKLRKHMDLASPYLEPALTIQDLANQLSIPVRELSVLINHHLDQHFFDFVNEYRIHKAMELLKDSSKQELTVLEILYKVGFNSKSSFNTAFKKQTDLTPTQYRNQA